MVYPYGCLEQTLSRAHGILASARLDAQLGITGYSHDGASSKELLQAAIHRLPQFVSSWQRNRLHLSWWPRQSKRFAFGTVYLDFLLAAQAHDPELTIPQHFTALIASCRDILSDPQQHLTIRCLAARALARLGTPLGGWLTTLSAEDLSREDAAYLALALASLQQMEAAEQLLTVPRLHHSSLRLHSPFIADCLWLEAEVTLGQRQDLSPEMWQALHHPQRLHLRKGPRPSGPQCPSQFINTPAGRSPYGERRASSHTGRDSSTGAGHSTGRANSANYSLEIVDAQGEVINQHHIVLHDQSADHHFTLQPGMRCRLTDFNSCFATWTVAGHVLADQQTTNEPSSWQLTRRIHRSKDDTRPLTELIQGEEYIVSISSSHSPSSRTNYAH